MQSILFLVYILAPLTLGIRNYQNSMIGKYNSGVPKVPNSQNIYDLYDNGKKKAKPVIYHTKNEDFDLRRDNSDTTEPPRLPLYFPIPGGQVGDYNPYLILLRLGPDGKGGIKIDSHSSSKSFGQYFPVPPLTQGNDFFTQVRGGKDVFLPGRGEYDVPIVQPREYSFPINKVFKEEYNGEMGGNNGYNRGSNGFNGESNGHNGEKNDYDHDMDVFNKIIEELTPPEKSHLSLKDPEHNERVEIYKRITNTLNGKVVEKDPLGYHGGNKGYNGGSNGVNGGSNGVNGRHNRFEDSNGAKKAVRQGYNIQYTGMKTRNKGYNGEHNGNNGENFEYNEDILGYTNRIKALPPLEKSFGWTSKSLSFSPEQQEIVKKYKQILDLYKGKTV